MEFLDKLGKVLMKNIVYTVVLAVAVILFLYFAGGDLIAGALTAGSAVVAYHMIVLLYFEYKKTSKDTKPVAAKAPAKKVVAKKAPAKKKAAKKTAKKK